MPLWIWPFLGLMIGYGGFVLWRAWNRRYFKYGPIIYSMEESPVYFWFFAFMFGLSELISLTLFALAVVATIWGPIFSS